MAQEAGGRRRWRWVALVCSASASMTAVHAQSPSGEWSRGTAAQPASVSAGSWLQRLQAATRNRSFEGTVIVGSAMRSSTSRIVHYCDGRDQFERIESLDGEMRVTYRQNELMQTVWPATRTLVVEQRAVDNMFPALFRQGDAAIAEYYDVGSVGQDRIAGFETEKLRLMPKDAFRYGWRLWAEKVTGLLLRAEIVGANNQVLEWSSFSNVVIGPRVTPEAVRLPRSKVEGYRVLQTSMQPVEDLRREGWTLNDPPPGFRFVRAVRRAMGPSTAEDAGGAAPVLQSIYSDGVTFVSVFVEPDVDGDARPEGLMSRGATHTLTRRQGEWRVTVVGDVPPVTLQRFAAGLRRVP